MSCGPCPAGYRCPNNQMAAPVACVNGTYQNETSQSTCLDCPGGFSCLRVDEKPVECGSGQYSPVGVSMCMVCAAGHRLDKVVMQLYC